MSTVPVTIRIAGESVVEINEDDLAEAIRNGCFDEFLGDDVDRVPLRAEVTDADGAHIVGYAI